MADRLNFERDGRDWPNRAASRFVVASGFNWHVQIMGNGPAVLLVHGTGASTHSWRQIMPILAQRFTVVAPDLPGHAFTNTPATARLSLPGMANALADLLAELKLSPVVAAGHSAGAAIIIRMCLDGRMAPQQLVSINGALLPFRGLAGQLFSPLARLLVRLPFVPGVMARRAADKRAVARVLTDTGSQIDPIDLAFYQRLFASPAHVAATIAMMANWDLAALERDLPRLAVPLTLIATGGDRAISPESAFQVRDLVAGAIVDYRRDLGHLAHEEQPEEFARAIRAAADAAAPPPAQHDRRRESS